MTEENLKNYNLIREENFAGFYRQNRGLMKISGKEAVQFLNGLITNDVAKLEDGAQMSAAFPNVQGRLLAYVRVLRTGEEFLFETEKATHEKIFNNLFRFTFAGDFFVEDLSENYEYFEVQDSRFKTEDSRFKIQDLGFKVEDSNFIIFESKTGRDFFVPKDAAENFAEKLKSENAVEISGELYEILRVENGIPKYGADMDETTVVLETNLDEAVSFNKGCYIGQEIIARIHFRGHVAKKLTGLIFDEKTAGVKSGDEIKSPEGKNAGKISSVVFSPKLGKIIALAYVRYDYLAENTELKIGEFSAKVKNPPFV